MIWPGATKNKGAGTPPIVTLTPPKVVGRGTALADAAEAAKPAPKAAAMPPGATAAPGVKLAAFTTPPLKITDWLAPVSGIPSAIKKYRTTTIFSGLPLRIIFH